MSLQEARSWQVKVFHAAVARGHEERLVARSISWVTCVTLCTAASVCKRLHWLSRRLIHLGRASKDKKVGSPQPGPGDTPTQGAVRFQSRLTSGHQFGHQARLAGPGARSVAQSQRAGACALVVTAASRPRPAATSESAPGLGSPLRGPGRDWFRPCHTRAGTGPTPATSH